MIYKKAMFIVLSLFPLATMQCSLQQGIPRIESFNFTTQEEDEDYTSISSCSSNNSASLSSVTPPSIPANFSPTQSLTRPALTPLIIPVPATGHIAKTVAATGTHAHTQTISNQQQAAPIAKKFFSDDMVHSSAQVATANPQKSMAAHALLAHATHSAVEPAQSLTQNPNSAQAPTPELIVFAQLAAMHHQNHDSQSGALDAVPAGTPHPVRRIRTQSGTAATNHIETATTSHMVTIEIPQQTGERDASPFVQENDGCLPSITCCAKPLICPGCNCTIL